MSEIDSLDVAEIGWVGILGNDKLENEFFYVYQLNVYQIRNIETKKPIREINGKYVISVNYKDAPND